MKNHSEGVSVIVPVYNREKLIVETIKSVLRQDYLKWELILIDDGSTDNSRIICKKYTSLNENIRFIERKSENKGASVCRNIGLTSATYDWIVFLDSDDLLAPWCLIQRTEKLKEVNFEKDFLVFPMLLFKEKPDDMMILQNINTEVHPLDRFLQRENVWLMSSVIWRKSFLQSIGGYREEALSFQDWEMNVRALISTDKWYFFDKMLPDNFYRQHGETISGNRYGESHTVSNLEMILKIFTILKSSKYYSEERRKWLAGFFTDLVNRYRYFSMTDTAKKNAQKQFVDKALQFSLLSNSELKIVLSYLKISRSYFYARFKFYRNKVENKFRKRLLKDFYPIFEKYQGNIEYHGKID